MSQTDNMPTFPTLAGCFRPVEEYHRLVEAAIGGPPRAAVELSAVDAYLMHQFAAFLPSPPAVVDLAGGATAGASTVFWWADPAVAKLIVAEPGPTGDGDDDWKRLAAAGGERLGLNPAVTDPTTWSTTRPAAPVGPRNVVISLREMIPRAEREEYIPECNHLAPRDDSSRGA
jgi:hypothetical protein